MSLSRFRIITFDLTDTLLQFRTSPGKQYGEIGAMFGVRCDNNELAINFKSNWRKMNRTYPNFGRNSTIGWQNWFRELTSRTFTESGVRLPEQKMIAFADQLIEIYKTSTCWQLCYGAIEFLNYLRLQQQLGAKKMNGKTPFTLGVIANFDPRLNALLRNMKIDYFFDFTLNSYDCNCEMPSKEIFDMAIKISDLKDVKPEQCLHIGDTPVTDYLGARSAGWCAALIHTKSPDYLAEKYGSKINEYHCFSSLYDLHKKISNNFVCW